MAFANHRRPRTRESGNIFTFLFGAVAVVGVVTAVTMQLVAGPIKTASRVNAINMVNAQMQASGRIIIIDAANQANSGDVDSDGTIEPREFTTQSGGITGGGSIPTTIGASRTDPWGTLYGYCVWNNGSSYGALTNILAGADTTSSPVPTVIALVSAGPDKTFQTTCVAYSGGNTTGDTTTTGVVRAAGDDIVMKWSYAEALAASAGLWSIKAGTPATATIGKNLEVTDPNAGNAVTASINRQTGVGDFLGITTDLLTPKTGTSMTLNGTLVAGPLTATSGNVTVTNQYSAGMLNVLGTQYSSGNTILAYGLKPDPTSASYLSSVYSAGNPFARSALEVGFGGFTFRTAPNADTPIGTVVSTDPQMVINTAGRIGMGTTTPGAAVGIAGTNFYAASNVKTDILNSYNSVDAPTEAQVGLRVTANIAGTGMGGASTNPAGNMTGGLFIAENSYSDHTNSRLNPLVGLGTNYGTANVVYGVNGSATAQAGSTTSNIVGGGLTGANYSTNAVGTLYGGINQAANFGGAVTNAYGAYNLGSNVTGATGTVTNLYGGYNYARNYSGLTSTSMFGAYNYGYNQGTATTVYGGFNDARVTATGAATTLHGGYSRAIADAAISGSLYAQYNFASTTAASTGGIFGTYTYAEIAAAGSASAINGNYTLARNFGTSGTLTAIYGNRTIAQNYGTNTVSNIYGNYIEATSQAAGTVTTITGNEVVVGGATGTVTNAYGVVADLSGTLPATYYGIYVRDEGTANSNYYAIYTAGTTKSYFGGNVGIGTTTPFSKLSVRGDTGAWSTANTSVGSPLGASLYLGDAAFANTNYYNSAPGLSAVFGSVRNNSSDLAFYVYNGVANSRREVMRLVNNTGGDRVGIGTTTPSTALHVNGTITATDLTLTSDVRKKDNVKALSNGLANVLRFNPISYTWKDGTEEAKTDKSVRYGFLAQEVEKIFPNLVRTDDQGMKSIDYIDLFAPVIDAIQTLNAKIQELFDIVGKLTTRIEALEKDNAALKARLDKLEAVRP